jgi:hypothetical protein
MTRTTEQPIVQALISTLRANLTLKAAVHGFHEGIAPKDTAYPFVTYNLVAAPYDDDWSDRTIRVSWDVWAWARDQVTASDIDQMVMETLEDSITVTGQTVFYARRTEGLRITEEDETGNRIYRRGGTYLIQTYQPLA